MDEITITSLWTLAGSVLTGLLTYLTTRRKYNAEIRGLRMNTDKTELENHKSMLDYYKMMFDDMSIKQKSLLEENRMLNAKINELSKQIESTKAVCERQQAEIDKLSQELKKYKKTSR